VRDITATDAARGFSDLLDAVERNHESFLIRRAGKVVAKIAPASESNGALVKALIRSTKRDRSWPREIEDLRRALVTDERAWRD
jgi:antitoxin (DNA-binding transcriptional repressor) of toxin-antitoxin stability system